MVHKLPLFDVIAFIVDIWSCLVSPAVEEVEKPSQCSFNSINVDQIPSLIITNCIMKKERHCNVCYAINYPQLIYLETLYHHAIIATIFVEIRFITSFIHLRLH